ncbi:MAG: type II secretion system protein GspL [Porticoccaceae bacterium]
MSRYQLLKFILALPGELVTTTNLVLPKGSRRHLQQIVPNLLEEQLAESIETLHFVIGKPDNDNRILCAIIARQQLDSFLENLREAGVEPDIVIPDYWMLTPGEQENTVRINGRLVTRCTDNTGWTVSQQIDTTTAHTLFGTPAHEPCAESSEWLPTAPLAPPLNLLQGNYAVTKGKEPPLNLKKLGMCALACSTLFVGYFLVGGWYFNHQAGIAQQQTTALYQKLFPNDKRIVNIRRQMEVHLQQKQHPGESTFFSLLEHFYRGMKEQTQPTTIRNLRYDKTDQALQIEIVTDSISSANNLQKSLSSRGPDTKILTANTGDNNVIARFRMGGNP